MNARYQIVELARKKKGFSAVVVDNRHPSGVSGVAVQWFKTTQDAVAALGRNPYEIIQQRG